MLTYYLSDKFGSTSGISVKADLGQVASPKVNPRISSLECGSGDIRPDTILTFCEQRTPTVFI